MNFLAHLALSGNSDSLRVGNFIGDFVKGKQLEQYPKAIQQGIRLHREIDFYTDQHPIVMQSKDRLRSKYRHYAGVIVDMFYDHYLAVHWPQFSQEPLQEFVQYNYTLLQSYATQFPDRARYMLPYMIDGDWLQGYKEIEGINQALSGMSRRTRFDSKMEHASKDLQQFYPEFETEFLAFFPKIQTFCTDWISQHKAM